MKWAVYWQPNEDIEIAFFKTEKEAREKLRELSVLNDLETENREGKRPFWDITLLQVKGEMREIPYDGTLALYEICEACFDKMFSEEEDNE
jgi:hypothetical protein